MLISYESEAEFAEYNTARGTTAPTGDVPSALVRASMALDAMYNVRWGGVKASYSQQLAWPRTGATWPDGTPVTGIPDQVKWATSEMALAELASPGILTPVITPGKVKTRARVEGAVDVSYATGNTSADAVASMIPVLTLVEGILFDLIGTRMVLPGVLVV